MSNDCPRFLFLLDLAFNVRETLPFSMEVAPRSKVGISFIAGEDIRSFVVLTTFSVKACGNGADTVRPKETFRRPR